MGKSLLGETLGAYSGTLGKCSAVREPHSVSPWDGVRLVLLLEEGFEALVELGLGLQVEKMCT